MNTNEVLHMFYWINNKGHCEPMKCVNVHLLHDYLYNVDYFRYCQPLLTSEPTKSHRWYSS